MPKAKKKAATTAAPSAICATPIADFQQLDPTGRAKRFVEIATQNRMSFLEMGKLHYLVGEDVAAWNKANPKKKPKNITDEIRSLAGIHKGTPEDFRLGKAISNASYASRIIREFVQPGHITEAQYDHGITFQSTQAIVRVIAEKSARQLTPTEVGVIMTNHPDTWDDELRSLFEHGMTVGEKAEAGAEAARKQVEAEAKRRDDEIKAAAEKLRKEQAAAQRQQQQSTPPSGATQTGPTETETDETGPETETETTEAGEPSEQTGADTGATGTTTGPTAQNDDDVQDAGLDDCLAMIGEIEAEAEEMSAAAQEQLRAAFAAAAEKIAARLTPTEVPAAA